MVGASLDMCIKIALGLRVLGRFGHIAPLNGESNGKNGKFEEGCYL